MNMIQQLVTPNQMVPSLNDDVESRFNEQDDTSGPTPIGLSFGNKPTLGQNFVTGAVIQPTGVAINGSGTKIRFNQNRPWQKSSGSPAQAFGSEDLDAE